MIVLHPSFKLTYFERLDWPQDWVLDASAIARQHWQRFKPFNSESSPEHDTPVSLHFLFEYPHFNPHANSLPRRTKCLNPTLSILSWRSSRHPSWPPQGQATSMIVISLTLVPPWMTHFFGGCRTAGCTPTSPNSLYPFTLFQVRSLPLTFLQNSFD